MNIENERALYRLLALLPHQFTSWQGHGDSSCGGGPPAYPFAFQRDFRGCVEALESLANSNT